MNQAFIVSILIEGALLLCLVGLVLLQLRSNRFLRQMQEKLRQAEISRLETDTQLQSILKLNKTFVETGDEKEIIQLVLKLAMQTTNSMGASFVPLDERGQPMATIRLGDFPFPIPDAFLEYLASAAVRQVCQSCSKLENHDGACVLLKGPFSEAMGIYCYPLRYAARNLGMLNLYMPDTGNLSEQKQAFLRSLVDATTLALESDRLRQRELASLLQLRSARQKNDLSASLTSMLENLQTTLEIDFATIALNPSARVNQQNWLPQNQLCAGNLQPDEIQQFDSLIHLAIETNQLLSSEQAGQTIPGFHSWIISPLMTGVGESAGVLMVGDRGLEHFHQRQIMLVRGMTEQISVLLLNAEQIAGLEYKVMMEERTRLAREIHDGLAQTLGFLKLQVAQTLSYLERGDRERLSQALHLSYNTLAAAYQDARQAIDGLRLRPGDQNGNSLEHWLQQIAVEFSSFTGSNGLNVILERIEVREQLAPEVHAQLIRIAQEALSNVRKHAHAHNTWISCFQDKSDIFLEIRDDGQGFSVEDVPDPSRYGLRGMRERAELLGADFQIKSRPGQGTTVRIRLPLQESNRLEV